MEARDNNFLRSLEEGLIMNNNNSAGAESDVMDFESVATVAAAACMEMQHEHDDHDAATTTTTMEKLSVDDLLQKWVGECGRAQLWHFVLVSLAWTIHGLQTLVMVFADRQPSWQCRPSPSLESLTSSFSMGNIALNLTGVANANRLGGFMQEEPNCSPTTALCSMDSSLWEWVGGKGASTVSEWNLVCGDEYKRGLAQCVFFIGGLFGAGVFGNLSDSVLGRKGALALACSATAISGMITAAAPNYWAYVFLRGVTGLSTGGVGLSSFVLATEPVGPSRRGQMGMSAFYFFSVGVMALPAFAFYTASWRLLYVATSIPAVVYCAMILPFVCESPRWYLIQGRLEEAMAVLRNFATLNGKSVPAWVGLATDEKLLLTDHVETLRLLAAAHQNSSSGLDQVLNNLTNCPTPLSAKGPSPGRYQDLSPSGYHEPSPGYHKPSPGYHETISGYEEPGPGCHETSSGYHELSPGYHETSSGHHELGPSGYHELGPGYHETISRYHETSSGYHELNAGYHDSHGSVSKLEPTKLMAAKQGLAATKFSGTLLDVMKCSGTRKRMLIMVVIWFNCAVVYYGINLNVVNIGFDLYLSIFTNGLVEIPAYAITALLLQKLGRRNLLVSSMLLGGVCCVMGSLFSAQTSASSHASNIQAESNHLVIDNLVAILPFGHNSSGMPRRLKIKEAVAAIANGGLFHYSMNSSESLAFARLLCGVIGIFGIAGAYNLIYIYTLELFPTVVRNAALGLTTQAAGIGAVIAPTIVALDQYNSAIPFSLFAAAALVGAVLALWLPETLNQPLWETLEGMEKASHL